MTAVATFPSVPRTGWANGNQNNLNQMTPDEVARFFVPRKSSTRNGTGQNQEGMWNLNGAAAATATGAKKKASRSGGWPAKGDGMRVSGAGSHSAASSVSSLGHQPVPILPSQHHVGTGTQPGANQGQGQGQQQSYLILLPLNDSFDPKIIPLPFYPDTLRIGRQTNTKTVPTPANGFFDSKVLSRQHAEVWAERNTGKVWIRDVKSSNGTFVNGTRLSQENRDSEPHELRADDVLELGIDIVAEDNKTIIHHKVAARVEHAGFQTSAMNDINFGDLDQIAGSGQQNPVSAQSNSNNNLRGRSASQGSRTAGNTGAPISHRQLPLLLQTISVEQIAKRLNSELHMAKQQSQELQRTAQLFDSFLNLEVVKKEPETKHTEHESEPPTIDSRIALESSHFEHLHAALSDSPKKLVISPQTSQNGFPRDMPSPTQTKQKSERLLKTEKPEPTQHLLSLMSQLRDARLQLKEKSAKVRDLEDLLRKERTARERAEDRATQLELASLGFQKGEEEPKDDPELTRPDDCGLTNGVIIDEELADDVSVAGSEDTIVALDIDVSEKEISIKHEEISAAVAAAEAAAQLKKRVEELMAELHRAKEEIESYKRKAKLAEEDGARSQKSLAEMVATIQADEERRRKATTNHAVQTDSSSGLIFAQCGVFTVAEIQPEQAPTLCPTVSPRPLTHEANGTIVKPSNGFNENPLALSPGPTKLIRAPKNKSIASQSAPYVSIVGVVILGVGVMAILNSWQKGER